MPEEKRPRELHAPIWGIFLLFLGIVFLLQSLNVLPWALWGTLWHFWPVLIIIVGLGILLARFNVWLVSLLVLAILFGCLGIATWQYGRPSSPAGHIAQSYSEPLGNLEKGQIEIDFSVGSLSISSLPPGSLNFVEVVSQAGNGNTGLRADFRRQGNEGRLSLSKEKVNQPFEDNNRYQVSLARNIPLTLNVKSAASDTELDLSQLEVTELRLDVDAGNCKVMMPSSVDTTNAYIKTDVANLEISIPEGVAARIQARTGLSALDINESRFPKRGDYYISDSFDTAQKRVYLEINSDVGRVQVK